MENEILHRLEKNTPPPRSFCHPKNGLKSALYNTLPKQKLKYNIYCIEKFIDFFRTKDANIICFLPLVNCVYLQVSLSSEKVKDIKKIFLKNKGYQFFCLLV